MKTKTKTQTKTRTQTRTRTKILKVFAIFALLLSSNQLIAQTLPSFTPSQTVCSNSTEPYEIPSTTQNASSLFTWTLSGGGIISSGQGTNYITIDWGVAGGPHILEVIEENGGCTSNLETLSVTIVDAPTAYAGSNDDICVGDIYSLSAATATNQVSVNWTTSGDGTFTNASATSLNPDYDPGPNDEIAGTVDLTLTSTGSGPSGSACATSSSTLTLTIHQVPTATAGLNDNVCAGSNYTLSGTFANGTGIWTTSGDGMFTNASSATSDYDPGPNDEIAGTVDLTWTVTGTAPIGLACASATSTMTLTIDASPVATAGPNDDICVGDIYSLSAATATNQVSVLWTTSGDGTFTNASATSLNPDYDPGPNDEIAGTVDLMITATGTAPAGSACATSSSTLTLTIHQVPTATAGSNDNVCAGLNYTLSGTFANGTGIWTTSGDGTFTNASSATSDYDPGPNDEIAGTVDLTWTVTGTAPIGLACNSATSLMTLTIVPAAVANAGSDDDVCEGLTYTLTGTSASNNTGVSWTSSGTGTWTNGNTLTPTYDPSAADIAAGSVTLTLTSIGNAPCSDATSTMVLTVIPNPIPGPIWHN